MQRAVFEWILYLQYRSQKPSFFFYVWFPSRSKEPKDYQESLRKSPGVPHDPDRQPSGGGVLKRNDTPRTKVASSPVARKTQRGGRAARPLSRFWIQVFPPQKSSHIWLTSKPWRHNSPVTVGLALAGSLFQINLTNDKAIDVIVNCIILPTETAGSSIIRLAVAVGQVGSE